MVEFKVLKKNENTESGINGIFHQFDNFDGTISFEAPLTKHHESKIFEFNQNSSVKNIHKFVASFVNRIAPNTYHTIVFSDGDSILISYDTERTKPSLKMFRYKSFVFDEDTVSQVIKTKNEGVVSLSRVLADDLKEFHIPEDNAYTKNKILNNILAYNFVSIDIDRQFIQTLSHVVNRIFEHLQKNKKESETFVIYKDRKKGFEVFDETSKRSKYLFVLTVNQSHFN